MKKIIFLIVFVPVHLFLTISLIQWYWINYNPNVHTALWQQLCRIMAFVFAQPIVWPVIITDLFEYWPIWIPMFFHSLNSLIWALVILAIFGKVKRLGKPIFLMVFVPLHSCWTAILVACYWFKYDLEVYTSLWGKLPHVLSFVFSLPIVWPMILSDEAAHSPTWIQFLLYILNSFIWAAVLLLIYSRLKRLLLRKIKRERLEPSVAV
ncbi:MAG: hypothetical protein ACYTDW_00635 [Planctomycetota bacterium]|jgi:hypothetical protein